jgi:hypothetical protein
MMTGLRWRWRRWRAAHYAWVAAENYRRWSTVANWDALERAVDYLDRVEVTRP